MERGFLGLMAIGNQSADQIDQKVERTAMAGVFDLGNILELVVDGLANGSYDAAACRPAASGGFSCLF